MAKETIIISLGGSLVAPEEIDIKFLYKFKNTLNKHLKTNKFIIIVGGGKLARIYQSALMEFGSKNDARDWMGINITKLNAEVVKQVFNKNAYSEIITNPNIKVKTTKGIILGAGWKPGCSTDNDAVLIAKTYKVKTIINLTNIDYVYDLPAGRQVNPPLDFTNAKPIKIIDWKNFQKIVGTKWFPGKSAPFDPIATRLAGKLKLKVVLINGNKLEQLERFLNGKTFIGTIIK